MNMVINCGKLKIATTSVDDASLGSGAKSFIGWQRLINGLIASGEIILSKNEKVVGIAIHPETGLMLQFE